MIEQLEPIRFRYNIIGTEDVNVKGTDTEKPLEIYIDTETYEVLMINTKDKSWVVMPSKQEIGKGIIYHISNSFGDIICSGKRSSGIKITPVAKGDKGTFEDDKPSE